VSLSEQWVTLGYEVHCAGEIQKFETIEEVTAFLAEFGLMLAGAKITPGMGCASFRFRHWDGVKRVGMRLLCCQESPYDTRRENVPGNSLP
jgi:hypothetical protein